MAFLKSIVPLRLINGQIIVPFIQKAKNYLSSLTNSGSMIPDYFIVHRDDDLEGGAANFFFGSLAHPRRLKRHTIITAGVSEIILKELRAEPSQEPS
jgi:hypothetical protein